MEILIIAALVVTAGVILYLVNSAIDRASSEDAAKSVTPEPEAVPVQKLPTSAALAKLKKAQIVELATERGIKLRINTKDQMIKELRAEHKKLSNPAKK